MRWVAKAVGAKVVGALPGGDALHYALQRRVTRTLPVGPRVFRKQRRRAVTHLRAYEQHGPDRPLGEAVFYEFGAGWDLTIPLVYWVLGVDHQVLALGSTCATISSTTTRASRRPFVVARPS